MCIKLDFKLHMYKAIYIYTHNQSERTKSSLRKFVLGSFKFNGSITHFLTPSPQDQVKNLLLFPPQFSSSYSPTLLGYMDSASLTNLLQHLKHAFVSGQTSPTICYTFFFLHSMDFRESQPVYLFKSDSRVKKNYSNTSKRHLSDMETLELPVA